MRGDLGDTGLAELLRGLSEASATGALHLDGPDGAGRIFLRDGRVYWAASPAPRARLGARLVGAGFLAASQLEEALAQQEQGDDGRAKLGALVVDRGLVDADVIRVFVQEQILDAVLDLFNWSAGSFEFVAGDRASEDLPVNVPVPELLIESARRQREWSQIVRALPSLDAIPHVGGGLNGVPLEPDERTLRDNIDGRRSVRELAGDLGYSEFETARVVYGLLLLGTVQLSRGRPAPPTEPASEPDPQPDVDVGLALEEALHGVYDVESAVSAPDDLEPEVWTAVVDDLDDAEVTLVAEASEPPADEDLEALVAQLEALQEEEPERPRPAEREPAPPEPEAAPAPGGAEHAPERRPAAAAGPSPAAGAAEPVQPDAEETPAETAEPARASTGSPRRSDVAELLRELSALSGGDVDPTPEPSEPEDPSAAEPEPPDPTPERPPARAPERPPPRPPERTPPRPPERADEDRRSGLRRLFGSR